MVIIIPSIYIISEITHFQYFEQIQALTAVFSAIFMLSILRFFELVFYKRKGTPEQMNDAIIARKNAKMMLITSVIITVILFVFDYFYYGIFLTTLNVDTISNAITPSIKLTVNGMSLAIFVSLIFAYIPCLDNKHYFGLSYAFFKSSQLSTFPIEEKVYHRNQGVYYYNKYLGSIIDLKIKDMDKVISNFGFETKDEQRFFLTKFLESYDQDKLSPMRYLQIAMKMKEADFLTLGPAFEDRLIKIAIPVISAIIIASTLIINLVRQL